MKQIVVTLNPRVVAKLKAQGAKNDNGGEAAGAGRSAQQGATHKCTDHFLTTESWRKYNYYFWRT